MLKMGYKFKGGREVSSCLASMDAYQEKMMEKVGAGILEAALAEEAK